MVDQNRGLAALIDDFVDEYVNLDDRIERERNASEKNRLERKKGNLCRKMADKLDQFEGIGNRRSGAWACPSNGRGTTLERRWVVSGVPSRQRKTAAHDWMRTIGIEWDGNAPDLRREVLAAVAHGEAAPGDWFGLSIEWTVHVERNVALEKGLLEMQAYVNNMRNS